MIAVPTRYQAHVATLRQSLRPSLLQSLLQCFAVALLATTAAAQETGTTPGNRGSGGRNSDQNNYGKQATAPIPQQAIEELLATLDAQFVKGDFAAYVALFQPDHVGSLAMLGRHVQRLSALTGKERTRTSKIIGSPMAYPNRTVVRVRHIIEWPRDATKKANAADKHRLVEDSYLAVRTGANGSIVPTFAIEMPPKMNCIAERKFRCPPCNYEIGGVQGFLCVPLRREQALALEAASFYLIGTDVVCDIHVLIPSKPKNAQVSAMTLATAFAKVEPSAKVGLPSAWLPPMHQTNPPEGMDSARVVVELPNDRPEAGGTRTIFHVVQFGGLQHILLVRSSAKSLQKHKAEVESLFKSYMLLEVDCEEAELAARPLRHHTGGMIDGATYSNERYGVELTGPNKWHAAHRPGGSMFRVHWTGPNGSQMWLIGYSVPSGMDAWTTKTADRWLSHHCSRHQLEPDDKQAASKEAKWHEGADSSWRRTCMLMATEDKLPSSPARRVMHVQLYEDLLLIVDGFGATKADEAAVRTAIQTLKRH